MKAAAVAATIIVYAADLSAQSAIECEPRRPHDARDWWSFRLIDGRQCWYAGRPNKPKHELYWSRSISPAISPVTQPEAVIPDARPGAAPTWHAEDADQLLAFTCCWPALEPVPLPRPRPRPPLTPPLWLWALVPGVIYAVWALVLKPYWRSA